MGNVSIDISVENIWRSWQLFRHAKKASREIDEFAYQAERHILGLWREINSGAYRHGGYCYFTVTDNKKRIISVASVRDRVVHRLLYEYLVKIYDKIFFYDVWSCRKGKGLLGAIERTQMLLGSFKKSFVWRADITKFFDNVDQDVLRTSLRLRVKDTKAFALLEHVITSYRFRGGIRERERLKGRREEFPLETSPAKFLPTFICMSLTDSWRIN